MRVGGSKTHYKAALKALEAAELSFKTGMHATAAAKNLGASRSATTVARVILEFGSDQDREDAYSGTIGLRTLADRIRKDLPSEVREGIKKRTGGALSEGHLYMLKTDRVLWAKLGLALRSLSELPHPSELILVVNSNRQRKQLVHKLVHKATKWIEEFTNEWERSQKSPSDT